MVRIGMDHETAEVLISMGYVLAAIMVPVNTILTAYVAKRQSSNAKVLRQKVEHLHECVEQRVTELKDAVVIAASSVTTEAKEVAEKLVETQNALRQCK